MTLRLREDVVVLAPPESIFDVICAPERLPEWNVSVDRARRAAPDEPICVGSRAVVTGRLMGRQLESETEVVEYVPPRVFGTRAIRGPKIHTRFELEPVTDGTRVFVDVVGDVPGGALGARLAEGFLRRELTASLQRLRALGEAAAKAS